MTSKALTKHLRWFLTHSFWRLPHFGQSFIRDEVQIFSGQCKMNPLWRLCLKLLMQTTASKISQMLSGKLNFVWQTPATWDKFKNFNTPIRKLFAPTVFGQSVTHPYRFRQITVSLVIGHLEYLCIGGNLKNKWRYTTLREAIATHSRVSLGFHCSLFHVCIAYLQMGLHW